ncbi:MAG: hypothetical protein HY012_05280 [Acidobacteria bacterium]|nr:hypothetical protein [Acidobacteriota bacterium]
MRRRIGVLLATLALAGAAWAGDAWKEKSYKDWDEKEVNKILSDSPWARPVNVTATWRSARVSALAPDTQRGGVAGQLAEAGEVGTNRNTPIADDSGAGDPEAHFVLRWGSARTTRQALARLAVLRGRSEAEAEKVLNLPVTEHQIVLYGADMTPFAKSDEKSLMEKTFLKLKKNKQKISPSRVEIRRGQDGKRISGIVFFFPMKFEVGEPVIAPDEKGVEFECRTNNVNIRQSFEPQKMVGRGGPDFQ